MHGKTLLAEKSASHPTPRGHHVSRAQHRVGVRFLTIEHQILIRLGASIDPLPAASYMTVVVHLMDDGNERGQVNNRQALRAGVFDAPLVEPHTSDRQRRYVSISVPTEDEKIDPRV